MSVSMNGPGSPSFPLPAWTLINESRLWTDGFPNGIEFVSNIEGCEGARYLAIFASQEDAQKFIDRTSATAVRPCAITDLIVFLATLNLAIKNGLEHVFRYCPEIHGRPFWQCDASKLRDGLADAARAGNG